MLILMDMFQQAILEYDKTGNNAHNNPILTLSNNKPGMSWEEKHAGPVTGGCISMQNYVLLHNSIQPANKQLVFSTMTANPFTDNPNHQCHVYYKDTYDKIPTYPM